MQTSAENLVQSPESTQLSFEECILSDIPGGTLLPGKMDLPGKMGTESGRDALDHSAES